MGLARVPTPPAEHDASLSALAAGSARQGSMRHNTRFDRPFATPRHV
jgi:hypothetical protein